MTDKMREDAIREAARNHEMDEYFEARPKLMRTKHKECLFEAGFDRAWQACAARMVPEGFVVVPKEILDRFPEINPSNYDHDDACALNAWGVELVLAAAPEGKK